MNNEGIDLATRAGTEPLDQARIATDAVVEARGSLVSVALESGSVVDIERAFYDLFLDVYVRGYYDGRSSQRESDRIDS
jgi:hypothetical protein